jgi:hypothetical protein
MDPRRKSQYADYDVLAMNRAFTDFSILAPSVCAARVTLKSVDEKCLCDYLN